MKKWVFIHLRATVLFLLLCSITNVYGSVNIERTIYLTVGSSTTINPWSVVSSNYSGYSCISTKVMGVSDNTALSVSTSSTTKTRYPTLYQTTGYSDGFYSTYKVQALKAGSYTVNTYVYCTKREGYMPTNYIIGDFFVLYHVIVTEAPKVTQISIPNNLTLTVGESYTFSPVIYETGASTTLTWNSSNPSIVSVNNGHIQALLPGSSNITCTASNGVSANCLVTVNPIFVTSISLDQTEIEIEEGGKYNLAVTIIPENATNKGIEWRSSNENIAFVGTNGTVVGVSSGYCNITANTTDGSNKSVSCLVHVFKPVYAESITLEHSSVEIIKGDKYKLTPIVTPSNTSNTSYTWTTNSPSCASVDNNGVVTALNEGTATITVTTNDGTNLSASCVFNVKRNKYQIVFMVNDEIYQKDSCLYGQKINIPETPMLTGYTFVKWNNLPEIMPAQDLIVEGVFTTNKYAITYYLDDEFYRRDSIEYNSIINLVQAPEKEGYSFSGWSRTSSTIHEGIIGDLDDLLCARVSAMYNHEGVLDNFDDLLNDIPERMPAHEIKLYGYFCINTYLLTYMVDDMIYRKDSIVFDTPIILIDEPEKQGYTFSGWKNVPKKMPAHDVIITGHFTVEGTDVDISTLNNAIYLNNTEGISGQQLMLHIKMKNDANIRGFQFDMYLPEGVNVVKNSKGRIQGSLCAERLPEGDEHTLTISQMSNGTIRFLCGSQYDEAFTGSDGDIVTLSVQIDESVIDGEYIIELKEIKLTETDISRFYEIPYLKSTLVISSYALGDINGDGKVDVSDYIGVANHIMGNTPDGFILKAADVDGSGSIDVSDYIGIANLIMSGTIYGR